MSATPAVSMARELPRGSRTPAYVPLILRVLAFVTIALAVVLVVAGVWASRDLVTQASWSLFAWALAVALVGALSVPSPGGSQLGLDMPLLLAVGFLFGPGIAGAIGFVAYVDVREFKGEIRPLRAFYNRAQTSLSVMVAAAVFMLAGGEIGEWPRVGLVSLLAVAADGACNYGFVVLARALSERLSVSEALRTLRLGSAQSFLLSYLSYGLLSPVLADVYSAVGAWVLASFALLVVLARQAFDQSRLREVADDRLREQSAVLRAVSTRIAEERRDERLSVAAGLHDEVLPQLYQVHLMGQVLRQDFSSGRLLDLEDDLPDMLRAVDRANEVVRGHIRGLRESPLGSRGFARTVELLARHLETLTAARFELLVEDIQGSPMVQLISYHVVREALMNAVRHADASVIRVQAMVRDGFVRLVIEDDGVGFNHTRLVGVSSHFGLSLTRERVELVGGVLHLESTTGRGTRVVARLPIEAPRTQQH